MPSPERVKALEVVAERADRLVAILHEMRREEEDADTGTRARYMTATELRLDNVCDLVNEALADLAEVKKRESDDAPATT